MKKIDYKKELKHLFAPSAKEPMIVDVPAMNFLMIDGKGDPNTAKEYKEAVETLFAVSYAVKFMIKKGKQAIDFGVLPLEGLWWTPDMKDFSVERKDEWLWTMMILQPEVVTKTLIDEAIESVRKKKNPAALAKLRWEKFHEGKSAQIMHIGPFADEAPTIEKLHTFITESGSALCGKHHEIYLSDPRKADPRKMKTIIRQPTR